ncbi:unnamed protein product, partial [Porites evermanni]
MASLENLGQTSGDYPIYRQNLGRSEKSLMGFKLFKKTDSKSETRRRSFSFLRRRSCSREERRSEDFLRPRRTGEGQSPE